jgi:uncharacterized protein
MANEGSGRGGAGNFAKDPGKTSDAGRKGGQHSHRRPDDQSGDDAPGSSRSPAGQPRGGSRSSESDPGKASEAGRKRGEHSQGGK